MPRTLTSAMLGLIAARFKVLAEPARLELLNALRARELTVGELVDRTSLGQANVSKHLQLLYGAGFVRRRKDGLFTYYAVADAGVFKLCDVMCGRLDAESARRHRAISAR